MKISLTARSTLFAMAIVVSGCQKETEKKMAAPRVVVQEAELRDVPIVGHYIGVTKASLDVEVRARVDGFIEEQNFIEGSAVKKGDLLYQIDNRPYQARMTQLEAGLEGKKAALSKAERDVERMRPLIEQEAISQLDYDSAISATEQASADVGIAKALLEEARLELDYTQIRAPIDGRAGESRVDIGSLVGNGGQSLLTTIKQIDPIYVRFNMSALDYLNVQRRAGYFEKLAAEEMGKALEGFIRITLPDGTEYGQTGSIRFTSPSVNPQTGTFSVRAEMPNPDRELLPGQHTRVRIVLDQIKNAVTVPEETLQIEQGGAYVMVVLPDHKVEQRFVVTGQRVDGLVLIESGLAAEEHVVIEGIHRVAHGQKVEPMTREEYDDWKQLERDSQLNGQADDA